MSRRVLGLLIAGVLACSACAPAAPSDTATAEHEAQTWTTTLGVACADAQVRAQTAAFLEGLGANQLDRFISDLELVCWDEANELRRS